MPLIRTSKLPPPPELGEKTFWDYFPKRVLRRVFFMLLALAAVVYLKSSGSGSFGGLFDTPTTRRPSQAAEPAFQHIEVKPPPKSAP